jgi:hypothetical protein
MNFFSCGFGFIPICYLILIFQIAGVGRALDAAAVTER